MIKKIIKLSTSITLMIIVLAGCSLGASTNSENSDEGDDYTIDVASVLADGDTVSRGLDKFAEIVEEKSEGEITVNTYHGGQLGSDLETYEAVQSGNLDMASGSIANISPITNAFNALHLPYMFDSKEQAYDILNNEKVRSSIEEELSRENLKWFASFDSGGPRIVATKSREINSPDDLEGLKLRASESDLEISSIEAMGAQSTTVDWPETPQAISQGMVDGVTVPLSALYPSDLYKTTDNIKFIPFQWFFHPTVVNEEKWESMPEDVKEILTEAVREAEEWQLEDVDELNQEIVSDMNDNGVEITSLPEEDEEKLKEKIKDSVWDKYIDDKNVKQEVVDVIQEEKEESENPGDWGFTIN